MIRRLLILAGAAVGALSLALVALCAWGATLPSDHTASGEREIPAPPELVFARITDPARYPHWRTGLRRVRLLNEDRWIEESTEGTLPFRFGARSRPSAVETIVDSTSLPFSGRWNFELEPLGSGRTRVRITERGTVSNVPMRALARFFAPPPDQALKRYLADLQTSFERI